MLHRHPHHLDDSPRRAAPDGRVVYPSGPSSITFLPALHHRAEFAAGVRSLRMPRPLATHWPAHSEAQLPAGRLQVSWLLSLERHAHPLPAQFAVLDHLAVDLAGGLA